MSDPYRFNPEVLAKPLVGIGRPVDSEWLDATVGYVNSYLPAGAEFHPRQDPSVTYVNPKELAKLGTGNAETDTEQARVFLAALAMNPETPALPTITEKISVALSEIDVKPGRKQRRLQIILPDTQYDQYDSGHLMEGERLALRNALGLVSNSRARPIQRLKLGVIMGLDDMGQRAMLKRLKYDIPKATPLGPVSPISL
ncbi:MAG: hypothetical protein AAB436_02260 [Patescibacteria group bacterium]